MIGAMHGTEDGHAGDISYRWSTWLMTTMYNIHALIWSSSGCTLDGQIW